MSQRTENKDTFLWIFYKTDFKKITSRVPMVIRIHDLSQILETNALPKTKNYETAKKEVVWIDSQQLNYKYRGKVPL